MAIGDVTRQTLIEDAVSSIVDVKYKGYPCKPLFLVSTMGEKVLITITHMGCNFSEILLFDNDISDIMGDLYNKTM